ncbi:ArsR family transcriptional regulator [Nocardia terpenica]|uniref:ArsR family transcriptional regulator n=1 Tax=Nocardia terpenica TaxID=455432 RepID=UPI002FE20102
MQAFLGDRSFTTAGLSAELGDVPPGSLYRQVARLADAGILDVVGERRARGTVERTYRLRLGATHRTAGGHLDATTLEDHRYIFLAYIAGILADFDHYVNHDSIDFARDGVDYRTVGLWLDDIEFNKFATELDQVLIPWLTNRPISGRKRHILHTIRFSGKNTPIQTFGV